MLPNQNLQIFANPMPKHTTSFVKASEPSKTNVMTIYTHNEQHEICSMDVEHSPIDDLVATIDVIPRKGQNKKSLDITFSDKVILPKLPNYPLYIDGRIYDKPTNGILIDPASGENVIIEEFFVLHDLYQDEYDKENAWIKTHNGFAYPTIGLIVLPLQIGPKTLDVIFSIIS